MGKDELLQALQENKATLNPGDIKINDHIYIIDLLTHWEILADKQPGMDMERYRGDILRLGYQLLDIKYP